METLKRPGLGYLQKKGLKKKVLEKCKKTSICPYCGTYNGNLVLLQIIYLMKNYKRNCCAYVTFLFIQFILRKLSLSFLCQ